MNIAMSLNKETKPHQTESYKNAVIVIVIRMDTATRVQILNETDYISHTLGKGMNPIILPPAMGK